MIVEGVVDELYGCPVDGHECRKAVIDEMPDLCRRKLLMRVMSQWWGVVGKLGGDNRDGEGWHLRCGLSDK